MADPKKCPRCGREIPPDAPEGVCPYCLLELGEEEDEKRKKDKAGEGGSAGRDRNLMFGVLGVQLRLVSPGQFLDAAAAWATDPSRALPERLVQAGVLSEKDRGFIDGLVSEAIKHHGGDEKEAFDHFGGESSVSEVFAQAGEPDQRRDVITKLGIPLGVEDVDLEDISAVSEIPGRYTRTSEYSRGGMGRILLVHDEYLSRDIAFKELMPRPDPSHPQIDGESPVRATSSLVVRFLREAKVTGQLEHPSIVPVYELGRRPNGTLYYTMKLVRGQTLSQALRWAAGGEARLQYLSNFLNVCQAIAYAHSRGVIHRDIKPSNIMIGEFGETVVIDWGLAKVLGKTDVHEQELKETLSKLRGKEVQDPSKTSPGARLGTPHYMAPEQAEGRISDLDERTDVFALGILLYEILTGKVPFDGNTTDEVFDKVIAANPEPVRDVSPEAPPELAGICARAMHKDPAKRYQSARELAEEIQRFQTGAMVHAYEYSTGEVLKRFHRRHRILINSAATAAAAILILGVFSYFNIRAARDDAIAARNVAVDARDNEAEARQAETLARAESDAKTYTSQIRLAQQYLGNNQHTLARETLWATDKSRRNWEWGYLLNQAYQELYNIPEVYEAALSPGGARIATASRTQPIRVFNAADGSLITAFDAKATTWHVLNLQFSPDGARILGATRNGEAKIWDAETGELLVTMTGHRGLGREAVFDPAGARVALATRDETFITLFNAATGEPILRLEGLCAGDRCQFEDLAFSADGAYFAATDGQMVMVWDAATGEEVFSRAGHAVALDPGSARAAVADRTSATIHDIASGELLATHEGHVGQITSIAFAPGGDRVVTASHDTNAHVWDAESGELIVQLRGGLYLLGAVFSSGGDRVLVRGQSMPLRVFDAETGAEVRVFGAHEVRRGVEHTAVAMFTPDATRAVTVASDDTLRVWDARTGPGIRVVPHPLAEARTLAQSPVGGRLATADTRNGLAIIQLATGQPIAAFASLGFGQFKPLAFSSGGERLLAALDPFTAVVLDVDSGGVIATFAEHDGVILTLGLNPAGDLAVTGARDGTARLWNAATGEETLRLDGHLGPVEAAAFAPDGATLATASRDGTARLWNALTGGVIRVLDHGGAPLTDLAWSPDGMLLATAALDGTVHLWNAESGVAHGVYLGHARDFKVAFSNTGDRLFAGAGYSGIAVWDPNRGEKLATAPDDTISVAGFLPAFSADTLLVTDDRRILRIEASPWRAEDLPGAAADPWRERFELLRRQQLTAEPEAPAPAGGPVPLVILTTRETAEARLQRLLAHLETELALPPDERPGDGPGLLAAEGPRRDALARLCIETGDRIPAMAGIAITSLESAVNAVEQALAALPGGGPIAFELERGGIEYAARWTLLPVVERAVTVQPAREEALAAFHTLTESTAGTIYGAIKLNQDIASSMGEPYEGYDGIAGFNVSPFLDSPENMAALHTLGRAVLERIVTIDGEPLTSLTQYREHVQAAITALENGEPYQSTHEVERGEFQRLVRVMSID